ncbi:Stage III sporulation protein AE [compost metagenome]
MKNSVGFIGIIVILSICLSPIIKLAVLSITYSLAAGIIEPLTDSKIAKLLDEIGDVFKLLLGIICAFSFMLIIGITLALKISNISIMYR